MQRCIFCEKSAECPAIYGGDECGAGARVIQSPSTFFKMPLVSTRGGVNLVSLKADHNGLRFNGVAFIAFYLFYRAGCFRDYRQFHFHGLEDNDLVSIIDRIAYVHFHFKDLSTHRGYDFTHDNYLLKLNIFKTESFDAIPTLINRYRCKMPGFVLN